MGRFGGTKRGRTAGGSAYFAVKPSRALTGAALRPPNAGRGRVEGPGCPQGQAGGAWGRGPRGLGWSGGGFGGGGRGFGGGGRRLARGRSRGSGTALGSGAAGKGAAASTSAGLVSERTSPAGLVS